MAGAETRVEEQTALRDAMEAYVEAWARTLRGPESRILTVGPAWLVDFGAPTAGRVREVVVADAPPEDVMDVLEEEIPDVGHWLTVVTAAPGETRERYAEYGYRFLRNEVLMHRDLEEPLPPARDVDVRRVATAEEAARVDATFDLNTIHAEFLDDPYVHHYYVTVDDDVVARASLGLTTSGLAVVDNVRTLPEHRGYGYARATVTRAIDDARHEGARTCMLAASEEGVSLYRRLGFEEMSPALVFSSTV